MADVTLGGGVARWRYGPIGRAAGSRYALAVVALVLGVAAVTESLVRQLDKGQPGQYLVLLCLVALATTLPLALPRPTPAAAAVAGAGVASLAALQLLTVAGVAGTLIAAYRLGRGGSAPVAVLIGVPFLVLALAGADRPAVRVPAVLLAALAPTAALAGIARRHRVELRENQAAQEAIAGTLLAHTARGERARIARELHDVVAHHISMIAVQAETARLTTPGMPSAGAQRLSAIGDTARAALTEMRRLLGVLREDAEVAVPERQPQPGLAQLNELIDEARDASGVGTRLILRGRPLALDPGVELAAYRIVQESLTNARRHAAGAAVDVELHYTGTVLRLLIRDNGPGVGPGGVSVTGGHGLLGMRERAGAVGGKLRIGPAASGGFLVEATLPASSATPPAAGARPAGGSGELKASR